MRSAQLIIVTSAAVCMCAWLWLRARRWKEEHDPCLFFPVLIVAGLLIRLGYALFTPVFYAPDEEPHYNYIVYLSEHRAFPVQTGKWGDGSKDWEYSQPPLYYLAMVPVYRAAEGLFHNRTATVLTLRFVSLLLWFGNVGVGILLLRRLRLTDPSVRFFVLALACLLPTYTFISAVINNDNLLTLLGAVLLYIMSAPERNLVRSFAAGSVLGLALLTKQSAVVFIPAFVVLAGLDWWKQRSASFRALLRLCVVLGLAGAFYGPWAMRNWRVYGTFKPEYLVPTQIDWPSVPIGLASAVHNLVKTFWAVSGISNNIGYPFPLVGMLFLLMCVVWFRKAFAGKSEVLKDGPNPAVLGAFLAAVIVNVLLVLRFGYLFGMGQGRHLFPVLYPIALLLGWVWRFFPVKNPELFTAVAWILYAFGFQLFSLYRFP